MKIVFAVLALAFSVQAWPSDMDDIQECLHTWKIHPFSETPEFRTIGAKVKVAGIGDDMIDNKTTTEPELVLLKPAVNVMSYNVINLLNPNGWYCMSGRVDVMGRTDINLDCNAHFTTAGAGATVMGTDETDGGVTVMGYTQLTKLNCKGAKQAVAD